MIKKLIEECIEKYYLDEEMYYSEDREDEKGDDISMKDELTEILTAKQVPFQISKEEGFYSPGYENSFLAVAFIDENGELCLSTVCLEIR